MRTGNTIFKKVVSVWTTMPEKVFFLRTDQNIFLSSRELFDTGGRKPVNKELATLWQQRVEGSFCFTSSGWRTASAPSTYFDRITGWHVYLLASGDSWGWWGGGGGEPPCEFCSLYIATVAFRMPPPSPCSIAVQYRGIKNVNIFVRIYNHLGVLYR